MELVGYWDSYIQWTFAFQAGLFGFLTHIPISPTNTYLFKSRTCHKCSLYIPHSNIIQLYYTKLSGIHITAKVVTSIQSYSCTS